MLLSVGYAACHWCHVMAHESFEDATTAAYMNQHFTNVKVDREERPDVDAVYMQATTAMTGQGGWPMTVVLTPDGEPFFAGTYFPDRPRHGQPAFGQILQSLADAWANRRPEVAEVAADVSGHLRREVSLAGEEPLDADVLAAAVTSLAGDFDGSHAGFGSAPKFPPSMVLEFLLRHTARTGSPNASGMADRTLRAMARGGMYDQLGGGFARYSVDRGWVVPHFEKMLYDNAQLLGVYVRWWRQSGDPLGARVARETADFLLAELRTEQGGLASALDADTEGVEGRFYAWTPAQLVEALGEPDGRWAAALLEVTDAGTFEHGASTLQLLTDPDDPERWASVRARLLAARAERVRPARDDKVVAAWNGLAVASLAEAGTLLGEQRYVDAALDAGRLLRDLHLEEGGTRLRRVSRDGVVGRHAGVLEDYALCRGRLPGAALRDRGRVLAGGGRPAAGHGAGRVRGRRRRLLRHRRRRRDAGDPAPRPLRQRQPLGPVRPGARPAGLRRRDRLRPAPGRGRGGAAQRPHPRGAGAALRRVVAGRRRGRRWPDRSRWRSWARPGTRTGRRSSRSPGRRAAPGCWCWPGSPTTGWPGRRGSRCSPVAGSSRDGPPPTCAGGWSATGR